MYLPEIKELRIGNKLLLDNKIVTVTALDIIELPEGVGVAKYHNMLPPHHFRPIKITEEWLLKLGFKIPFLSDEWTSYVFETCFVIGRCNKDCDLTGAIKGRFYWDNFKEIKFVHRLQNLVFELTDKELIIIE